MKNMYNTKTITIGEDTITNNTETHEIIRNDETIHHFCIRNIDENYNNGAALFLLGDCYRLTDQKDLALECFEKVVELYPSNKWGKQAKVYIAVDDTKLDAKEEGE